MKNAIVFLITGIVLYAFAPADKNQQKTESTFEPIAVVELFTSQGCSSCPSADNLFAKTKAANKNSNLFLLAYHVDYWNRLGWKDPFSSKDFSDRQQEYAAALNINGVYTPQVVVNGKAEFVGSNETDLQKNITNALKENTKAKFIDLNVVEKTTDVLKIKYKLEGETEKSKMVFLLISDKETTEIKKGENEGLTLTNENIVTQINSEKINTNKDGVITIAINKNNTKGQTVVALIQENETYKIIGAAKLVIKQP